MPHPSGAGVKIRSRQIFIFLFFQEHTTLALAIFDLDNTLLSGDSDHLWGDFLVEKGIVDAELYKCENDRFYREYDEGKLDIFDGFGLLAPKAFFDQRRHVLQAGEEGAAAVDVFGDCFGSFVRCRDVQQFGQAGWFVEGEDSARTRLGIQIDGVAQRA